MKNSQEFFILFVIVNYYSECTVMWNINHHQPTEWVKVPRSTQIYPPRTAISERHRSILPTRIRFAELLKRGHLRLEREFAVRWEWWRTEWPQGINDARFKFAETQGVSRVINPFVFEKWNSRKRNNILFCRWLTLMSGNISHNSMWGILNIQGTILQPKIKITYHMERSPWTGIAFPGTKHIRSWTPLQSCTRLWGNRNSVAALLSKNMVHSQSVSRQYFSPY